MLPTVEQPGGEMMLGIPYLDKFRSRQLEGTPTPQTWNADNTLLSGLRLGLQETFAYLHSARPTLEQFERWILDKNGGTIEQERLDRINPALRGELDGERSRFAPVLTAGDLWMNTDQCGFNPPERSNYRFPGQGLHWDVSLELPVPFGTQALLYLTDTPPEQGAFQCVPGFHRMIEEWLTSLPPGVDPRSANFTGKTVPVAGQAGDLLVWHHALPHGASPNRGRLPRVVQYMNMRPSTWEYHPNWS